MQLGELRQVIRGATGVGGPGEVMGEEGEDEKWQVGKIDCRCVCVRELGGQVEGGGATKVVH